MERQKRGQPSSRATPAAKWGKKGADERQFSRADDALTLAWAADPENKKPDGRISWVGSGEALFPGRDPPVKDKNVCKRYHKINDNVRNATTAEARRLDAREDPPALELRELDAQRRFSQPATPTGDACLRAGG